MYELLLLLHILAVVVAFAGSWTSQSVLAYAAGVDGATRQGISGVVAASTARLHLPALVLAGAFGIGLIFTQEAFEFSQVWISLAFLLWFALLGVVFFLVMPAQRRLAGGELGDPNKKLAMATGIVHLLFVLMLIDMIWKPGL